jgi:hypothetical protein
VITYTQRSMLDTLARYEDGGRWGWGSGSTNPTGCALEKKGLVEFVYDHSKIYPWGRWVLTDAGRAATSKTKAGLEPQKDPQDV